ncbi:hypothetical protein HPB52_008240 [Rhipicephalus sanguineus]|uniref:THAP-type domain-containing protein n=1 Tax=Rhipicephalus sanguineus TaxID=34632 RepID=A0A9D4PMR7_RHISA|nr:hypothetical protein HPB52_008240 [Rhipicephalus sanguineus]
MGWLAFEAREVQSKIAYEVGLEALPIHKYHWHPDTPVCNTCVQTLRRKYGFLARIEDVEAAERKTAVRTLVCQAENAQWCANAQRKTTMALYCAHKAEISAEPLYDNSVGSTLLFDARAGALRTLYYRRHFDADPDEQEPLCRLRCLAPIPPRNPFPSMCATAVLLCSDTIVRSAGTASTRAVIAVARSDQRKKQPGVSFHEMPADATLREQWLKVISRKNWQPNSTSNYSAVCSLHFFDADFREDTRRRMLKPGQHRRSREQNVSDSTLLVDCMYVPVPDNSSIASWDFMQQCCTSRASENSDERSDPSSAERLLHPGQTAYAMRSFGTQTNE